MVICQFLLFNLRRTQNTNQPIVPVNGDVHQILLDTLVDDGLEADSPLRVYKSSVALTFLEHSLFEPTEHGAIHDSTSMQMKTNAGSDCMQHLSASLKWAMRCAFVLQHFLAAHTVVAPSPHRLLQLHHLQNSHAMQQLKFASAFAKSLPRKYESNHVFVIPDQTGDHENLSFVVKDNTFRLRDIALGAQSLRDNVRALTLTFVRTLDVNSTIGDKLLCDTEVQNATSQPISFILHGEHSAPLTDKLLYVFFTSVSALAPTERNRQAQALIGMGNKIRDHLGK